MKEQKKEDAYRTFQEVYMATVYRSVLLEEEVKAFAARMEEAQVPYAFSRLVPGEGSRRFFSPEDHFVFLCFHLAKHLNSSGAGIRMVMDLALFLKAYRERMDWGYIREQLAKLGMDRFAATVLQASGAWFGISEQRDPAASQADPGTLEELKYYIMTGGIFGFERDESIRRLRSGISGWTEKASFLIRAKALWRIAFPKKKHMIYFLPALERYPVLLPLAWVKRWRIGLANRWKIRAAFRGIDRSGSLEEAKMQYRLLKKIGL